MDIYTKRAHYLLEDHYILEVIVYDFPHPPDSRLPADFSQISADFQTLISCIQCDYHTHSYQPNFLQCICMPYPVTVAHDLMWYFVQPTKVEADDVTRGRKTTDEHRRTMDG